MFKTKNRVNFCVRILLFFILSQAIESIRILSHGKVHTPLPTRFEIESSLLHFIYYCNMPKMLILRSLSALYFC